MKLILPLIVLFVFFFSPLRSVAQETSSKTLLWRISGKGLQKPSYLYGTMHLKDRRLFFFGDSVYKSLEASQAFAMELDPNEMMDSLFSKMDEADTTSLLRKLLDERKFKSVAKKLEKKFGMPADKISRKQLIKERENWYYNIHKSDDMKTVVDLYLYDIAHKQGKLVGGIEDVSDQFGITDELGKDVNIVEYIDDDNDEKRKKYLEQIIALYAAEDIDKIDQVFSGSQSQKTRDILLVNRNIKMAARMDSLSHIRNSFFAVGAAHLPGETGLIHLLKNKGFNVTPVFSSKKVAPEKYNYTAHEIPWVKFSQEDSAYTVEMPGKASDLKIAGDEVKLKVYADLVTNIVFMTGFSFISTDESREASMDRMIKSFLTKGFQKLEEKKINNRGIEGGEVVAVREKIYYRIEIFSVQNKAFIVMAGGEKKENLYTKDVERFLLSFTMNPLLAARPNNWVNYADTLKAFKISFPKKPAVDKLRAGEGDKNFETTTYTTMDMPNATYYLVVVSDTKKGFVITDDSLVFNSKLNYYKENKAVVNDVRKFGYEGNDAMSFSAGISKDGLDFVTKTLVICRGNRSYFIAVVAPKGKEDYPDVTNFFRSFNLMPYKETRWAKKDGPGNEFNTWAPSSLERQQPDTTGLSAEEIKNELIESRKTVQIIAHDPNSVTTYNVVTRPVSKYYQAKNDSIFLAEQSATYFSDTASYFAKANPGRFDSLIYKKPITNGNVKGVELLVKNAAKPYYKRIRILPRGDSSCHLSVLAPYAFITNENNNKFFEDFRFTHEDLPSGILKNKTAVILADLTDKDSATRADALAALGDTKFEAADLPLLHQAYLKQYPKDTTSYSTINEKISAAISAVRDSSTVSFVLDNYLTGNSGLPELKMDMLEMLAKQQTSSAINALKGLLLKSPPVNGSANSFIYALEDSLLLTGNLFPEAGRFFGDSLLGAGMIGLASQLIDSNILKKDILQLNLQAILHTANAQLAQLKNDKTDYPFHNNYVIDVLGKLNDKQSIGLLNGFLKIADLYVKQNAVLALLKIKQPVAALEIHKIASEKDYRTDFYKALKEIGKEQLFPADILTQPLFAEAYLYNYASEDDVNNTVCKLLGERVTSINGLQCRFYLFKVSYDYDGETATHFAVCGQFDINKKNVVLKPDDLSIKIFYDEKYTPSAINKLFDEFITEEKKKGISPVVK